MVECTWAYRQPRLSLAGGIERKGETEERKGERGGGIETKGDRGERESKGR